MKRLILFVILVAIPLILFARVSDWVEVQVVKVPKGTVLYTTRTDTGKIKYTLRIMGLGIPVSASNAEKYLAGDIDLEVVKWYNKNTGKYRYTTRQHKVSTDIDLEQYFKRE